MEELNKLNNLYNEFIGELDKNVDFDKTLIGYLEAIQYVAKIDADNINKGDINDQIGKIVTFIKKYKETHYEISKIKGFKIPEKELSDADYYYYLADQKAKALVYYTRYLNFLEHCSNKDDKKLVALIGENSEHKKYFMFNNKMREIEFYGASYDIWWRWVTKKRTIFRAQTLYKQNDSNSETNEEYIKDMFTECVNHMSKSRNLLSFSKNGLVDVYKYLYPFETENGEYEAKFNIIKNADINCIFGDFNNEFLKTFQQFIDEKDITKYKNLEYNDLGYTVEIYPEATAGEDTNAKGTITNIKDRLQNYFRTWDVKANKIEHYVADDKEVICKGKIYNKVIKLIDDNDEKNDDNDAEQIDLTEIDLTEIKNLFSEACDGTLFSMTLTQDDMIYLLLKIYEIKLGYKYKNKDQIRKELENICKEKHFHITENEKLIYTIYNKAEEEYIDDVFPKYKINTRNFEYFIEILNEYYVNKLGEQHPKSDFILTTLNLNENDFKFVELYNQYKQDSNKVDKEIVVLKDIIFKRELN